jgi:hypothetical protein
VGRDKRAFLFSAVAVCLVAGACGGGPTRATTAATATAATATAADQAPSVPSTVAATFPLTGLATDGSTSASRPALSIKIDNAPPALPQSGLNDADIVTEALVEGGLTRLMATYESHDSPLVGPIRSARPVDADLLRALNGGIFAYSGAATGEIAPVKQRSTAVLLSHDDGARGFRLLPSRRAPSNLFASTADLYAAAGAAGAHQPPPPALFPRATAAPTDAATAVHTCDVPMSGISDASWRWDGTRWVRTQNGKPDVLADGQPVTADNVVVLSVAITGTGIYDAAHNEDPLVIVTGSGAATVLRGGVALNGIWQRASATTPLTVADSAGTAIPLVPGRTWIELQPHPHLPVCQ